jgi:hypothetical protein
MNKIDIIKKTAITTFNKAKFVTKKNSPEILIGVGIGSIVAGTVVACRATLKLEDVIEKRDKTKDQMKAALDFDDSYNEHDYSKDLSLLYLNTGFEITKLYAPAFILGTIGIGFILGSHNIMKKRNVAITMAYKTMEKGFSQYRGRVIDELGEEKDREFKYGIKQKEIEVTETGKNGKKKTVKKKVGVVDTSKISPYARYFDESNFNWSDRMEQNRMFLQSHQTFADQKLKARGHLFLNEVYDMLGFPHTPEGQIVGWVLDGEGDGFVDFGMFDVLDGRYLDEFDNDTIGERRRDFINTWKDTPGILLDFNVDGVVYDLI